MIPYLVKTNLLLIIVWLFCRYMLGNDMHFTWRRRSLLIGVLLALICPLFTSLIHTSIHVIDLPEISFTGLPTELHSGNNISATNTGNDDLLWKCISVIYLTVSTILLLRMMIRIASIWVILRGSQCDSINGLKIRRVSKSYGSIFSFFHYIFVPDDYIADDYMIAHELAHVRQHHSVDVIVSELLTVVFWYNPAAWMIRREIRDNLEFMADAASVTTSNKHQYQMSLLQNITTQAIAKFYNNFNVTSIKRRIKMMNRKSSGRSAFRYLMALPVVSMMFLVGCSGSNTSNSTADNSASDETENAVVEEAQATEVVNDTATETLQNEQKTTEVWTDGDAAEFPGGYAEFMMYMAKNLKYPQTAVDDNVEGKVLVSFTVDKTGAVVNPKIVKSVRADLDSAAIDVVRKSPKWKPAPSGGDCQINVPVNFKLQ